jgi:hypothetical protein
VTFKDGTGVLEVLFGVGLGGGDAVKGFVEDGDDAVLFGEGGERYLQRFYKWEFYPLGGVKQFV